MKTGQWVLTRSINDRIADDTPFSKFVWNSMQRYVRHDWGDMDAEDKARNDEAVQVGNRVLAAYNLPDGMEGMNNRIYIITEADRSVTTILWPSEY